MLEYTIKQLNGNQTIINPHIKEEITPINTTSSITANIAQIGNRVPSPPKENIEFSKICVDENHK